MIQSWEDPGNICKMDSVTYGVNEKGGNKDKASGHFSKKLVYKGKDQRRLKL